MKDKATDIFDLLTEVYGISPWNLEQIITDMGQENTDYFLEYVDGQLVGFLSIQNLVGELEITNIAVRKDFQGQGYAKRLMNALKERTETIFLEVRESNLKAQALYSKYQFEVIGKRPAYYHNPTEDAILMRRERN